MARDPVDKGFVTLGQIADALKNDVETSEILRLFDTSSASTPRKPDTSEIKRAQIMISACMLHKLREEGGNPSKEERSEMRRDVLTSMKGHTIGGCIKCGLNTASRYYTKWSGTRIGMEVKQGRDTTDLPTELLHYILDFVKDTADFASFMGASSELNTAARSHSVWKKKAEEFGFTSGALPLDYGDNFNEATKKKIAGCFMGLVNSVEGNNGWHYAMSIWMGMLADSMRAEPVDYWVNKFPVDMGTDISVKMVLESIKDYIKKHGTRVSEEEKGKLEHDINVFKAFAERVTSPLEPMKRAAFVKSFPSVQMIVDAKITESRINSMIGATILPSQEYTHKEITNDKEILRLHAPYSLEHWNCDAVFPYGSSRFIKKPTKIDGREELGYIRWTEHKMPLRAGALRWCILNGIFSYRVSLASVIDGAVKGDTFYSTHLAPFGLGNATEPYATTSEEELAKCIGKAFMYPNSHDKNPWTVFCSHLDELPPDISLYGLCGIGKNPVHNNVSLNLTHAFTLVTVPFAAVAVHKKFYFADHPTLKRGVFESHAFITPDVPRSFVDIRGHFILLASKGTYLDKKAVYDKKNKESSEMASRAVNVQRSGQHKLGEFSKGWFNIAESIWECEMKYVDVDTRRITHVFSFVDPNAQGWA